MFLLSIIMVVICAIIILILQSLFLPWNDLTFFILIVELPIIILFFLFIDCMILMFLRARPQSVTNEEKVQNILKSLLLTTEVYTSSLCVNNIYFINSWLGKNSVVIGENIWKKISLEQVSLLLSMPLTSKRQIRTRIVSTYTFFFALVTLPVIKCYQWKGWSKMPVISYLNQVLGVLVFFLFVINNLICEKLKEKDKKVEQSFIKLLTANEKELFIKAMRQIEDLPPLTESLRLHEIIWGNIALIKKEYLPIRFLQIGCKQ